MGGSTSSTVPNAPIFNYTKFDACNPNENNFSHIRLTMNLARDVLIVLTSGGESFISGLE